jgi:HSP20 family protein
MSAPLTLWHPTFGMLDPFHKEMDEAMRRFFGDEEHTGRAAKSWTPRVDVEETEKEFLVKADLPGVDPKKVEISVEDGVMTIRGEKVEEKTEEKKNYHRVERFDGVFFRAIPLPSSADAEKVSASSANGVVTVSIPKKPEAQPRKVAITTKE